MGRDGQRARLWVGAVIGVLAGACTAERAFSCNDDLACGDQGVCTEAGYCAFPDADCPGRLRYGEFAGELSGTCVPGDAGTGPGATSGTGTGIPGPMSTSVGGTMELDPTTGEGPSSSSTTAAGSSSTGELLPPCGDGDKDDDEECDDGDREDGDGCSSVCTLEYRYVFVTGSSFSGDLGGLDGADLLCQALATGAGLPGTYMAWLSDDVEGPATRFVQSQVPYILVDGQTVAANWADLVDGQLQVPIDLSEDGTQPGPSPEGSCEGPEVVSKVFTGTDVAGLPAPGNCAAWTVADSSPVRLGDSRQGGAGWTSACSDAECGESARLYCMQQ